MSKFFKSLKKEKVKQVPVPRDITTIKKEYSQLSAQAGELQYQIFAFKKQLDQVNDTMLQLNYEGAARQKLDLEAAQKNETEKTKETANV